MKRDRMIGIFILMMAVLGFFFVSHASQTKKTTTKSLMIKTVTPSKTKVKGKKSLKFKHDLVVEEISLKGGFIAFRLKNKGPGAMPDEEHKQGEVKISYKGFEKTYPFSKFDKEGNLKTPGGVVTYETKEKLTSRQDVTVLVYFGKKISKPGKKISLKRTLGKKPPSLVQKPGKKAGLKGISKASTKQEKALKILSKKGKTEELTKAKPLISIAKVYLKDGKVHIAVKNKGQGRLSALDYRQGEVVLSYGGKIKSWSLRDVDPKGHLSRYGAEVVFDTGISLKQKERVKVSIEKMKGHPVKIVRLTPLKTPSTSVVGMTGSQKSTKPVPMDLSTAKKIGPLPENINIMHPKFEKQTIDPSQLTTLDIRIINERLSVKYNHHDYGCGFININYFCDPGIYNGPVEFHIRVFDLEHHDIVNETFIDQESADMYASFQFCWDYEYGMVLYYQVEVNPNHTIPETYYGNNHKSGQLYINNGPVKFMERAMYFPGLASTFSLGDGGVMNLSESSVKNDIEHGAWWYYDPYDPNCNMIMMNIKVWIGNPTCYEVTLPIHLYYIAYNGERDVTYNVTLAPGRDKWVTMAVGLNMQNENYIQVVPIGVGSLRVNVRFNGLPYDLD